MNWFTKTSYPEFWNTYSKHFKNKQETDLGSIRFVVFDTETTGLNPNQDRILSIGTVGIFQNTIKVSDSFECYLKQDLFKAETVKIHGLLKGGKNIKIDEKTAIIQFLEHIKNSVLVAHNASFDVTMINKALKRLELPKLKNIVLDTKNIFNKTNLDKTTKTNFSLDELSERFKIPQHDRHTASGDAFITALLFVKLISHLKKEKKITLNDIKSPKERIGLL
ncbi:DNA polymerase-3 subunit epsilon [Tenacibaculum adriaticum]|uniref:DNA polymerase-3 subunit epsilon n=1 Tax=Tenacibaculum adriaticum TaxID=413713 RepID=A0A5S5DNK6_9FLAO|nr:3'-5' exonuclease [Tenacibaculum adriaticum]TYP96279.1 DNA polymerase-3 subunit epsilon [Tenacibaculum adriaticum]